MLGNIIPSEPRRNERRTGPVIAWFPDPGLLITENSSLVQPEITNILPQSDDGEELRPRSNWPLSAPEHIKRRVRPVREI